MTAQSAIPLKWYVPFANGDSSRVELPVTTADPTRASQTLGFPPLTMQPPESGGVPPQGEDFNGGMNQVARICWWVLNGGGWPYDATFATNSNINGYPNGAKLQSADFRGDWINTADNNQNNPDTNGTNWVPGFQYGVTALTGLTGGTVTPTPAQAAKNSITLAGTLGSALTIVLPTWTKNWTITNSTTGAFVTIVKTAAGSGVTIPQNGSPTRVSGDGTNIVQAAENVATATSPTHPVPMSQAAGVVGNVRNLTAALAAAATSVTFAADEVIVETALGGTRYCLASVSQTLNVTTTGAGGMDTGAAPASGFVAVYAAYNPATGARTVFGQATTGATVRTNIYSGANAPSGFTATALIAIWPTNGSSQLIGGYVQDREFLFAATQALVTSTPQAAFTALPITAAPGNAKTLTGYSSNASTGTNVLLSVGIAGSPGGGAAQISQATAPVASSPFNSSFRAVPIVSVQTLYYTAQVSTGTMSFFIFLTGYTI